MLNEREFPLTILQGNCMNFDYGQGADCLNGPAYRIQGRNKYFVGFKIYFKNIAMLKEAFMNSFFLIFDTNIDSKFEGKSGGASLWASPLVWTERESFSCGAPVELAEQILTPASRAGRNRLF